MKLTVSDMQRTVTLADVEHILRGHEELRWGAITVDLGEAGSMDVNVPKADDLMVELFSISKE